MKKFCFALFLFFTFIFTSCNVMRQAKEMKMLSKCEFRINSVTDIYLDGINVSRIQKISAIMPMDMLRLTNAVLNSELPLNFNLNLEVKNPNEQAASLNRLEWILFIDGLQMLQGTISEKFTILAGETGMLPVQIGLNLAEVLSDERSDKLIDFGLGLAEDTGETTRVTLKLKPSIMVGQRNIMYPGWIEVRNEFTAQ